MLFSAEMVSNLPEAWDEGEFIDQVSCRQELFDISHILYSNNKHRRYCFRQIRVIFNVDGKIFFYIYLTSICSCFCCDKIISTSFQEHLNKEIDFGKKNIVSPKLFCNNIHLDLYIALFFIFPSQKTLQLESGKFFMTNMSD